MICLNCGRENPDGVKFCCFCGASAANAFNAPLETTAQNLPENGQLDVSESDALNGSAAENRDNGGFFSQSPDLDALGQSPSVPRPCVIPTSSEQSAAQNAANPQPMPAFDNLKYPNAPTNSSALPNSIMMNVPIESAAKSEKNGAERKFTTLHIVLCLTATAVCAIAAGIFAGLYFSVV